MESAHSRWLSSVPPKIAIINIQSVSISLNSISARLKHYVNAANAANAAKAIRQKWFQNDSRISDFIWFITNKIKRIPLIYELRDATEKKITDNDDVRHDRRLKRITNQFDKFVIKCSIYMKNCMAIFTIQTIGLQIDWRHFDSPATILILFRISLTV